MVVELISEGMRLLYLADVALHPIHLEYPNWYGRVDRDPEQTVMTRIKTYRWAVEKEALVLAFHFPPFPSLGHIVAKGDRWEWKAINLA